MLKEAKHGDKLIWDEGILVLGGVIGMTESIWHKCNCGRSIEILLPTFISINTVKKVIENRRKIECECNLTDSCASCYLYDDIEKDLSIRK